MAKDDVFRGLLLTIFLSAIVGGRAQWAIEDEGCRTPDRGVGSCVVIHSCAPIIAFLKEAQKPLNQADRNLLQSYQCGFDRNTVKVCCPEKPIVTDDKNVASRNPPPPNADRHRKRYLFDSEKCGTFSSDDRIINGNKTGVFDYPWMALLSYQTSNGPDFRCGGTIINERYILTAAHCLASLGRLRLLGVRVGEHDIRTRVDCDIHPLGKKSCAPPYQDLAIEETIPHPEYNRSSFQNDIGLLRTATPIDITAENVNPICLPFGSENRDSTFAGSLLRVTGWGVTELGNSSPDLLVVSVPVIENDACANTYKKSTRITHKQMCAGGKDKKDSCGGDSGGPLQSIEPNEIGDQRYTQQGVVSFGPKPCGQEGMPGVYTRVVYFMDWILDTVKP